MANRARAFLSLLLLTGVSMQNSDGRPKIDHNQEDIVFPENREFKLKCEGKKAVCWKHTTDDKFSDLSDDLYKRMKVKCFKHEDVDYDTVYEYQAVLDVEKAQTSDTGYFYCLNNGTTDYNDPENVDKIYVYVKSTTELLVQQSNNITIKGTENSPVVLPCRPTSPDVNVTLFRLPKGTQVYPPTSSNEEGEPWKFHPQIGFYVNRSTVEHHAHRFTCNATAPYAKQKGTLEINAEITNNSESKTAGKHEANRGGTILLVSMLLLWLAEI